MPPGETKDAGTHEYQGGVEILIVLLHVLCVVLRCLSFVHGVKVKFWVIVIDWLEVHPEGILNAMTCSQFVCLDDRFCLSETHHRGSRLTVFAVSSPLIVGSHYRRVDGTVEERGEDMNPLVSYGTTPPQIYKTASNAIQRSHVM